MFETKYYSSNMFQKKFPDFWNIVKPHTYGPYVMDFDIDSFRFVGKIILQYIANFSVDELKIIDAYLVDLIGYLSGINEEGFNEVLHLCWHFEDELKNIQQMNKDILKELLPKINNQFIYQLKYYDAKLGIKVINNPWKYRVTSNIQDNESDDSDTYYIINELQREKRAYHYYLMIYVFDLTLRMQKIKSEIIKYELTLYKKTHSMPLEFMINELSLEYIKLNKEFVIYNKKLVCDNYWTDSILLYPNNINILNHYYNIGFNWHKKQFTSVLQEIHNNAIDYYKKNFEIP